jgi:hypothetical protein
VYLINILSAAVVQSEAQVEAAKTLTQQETTVLEKASAQSKIVLELVSASKVLAPAFTVSGLEVSYDGTNYVLAQGSLGLDPCTAVGVFHAQITFPLIGVKKMRLVMAGSAPDGANYLTLTARLRLGTYPGP